jgi:hypothetical protein
VKEWLNEKTPSIIICIIFDLLGVWKVYDDMKPYLSRHRKFLMMEIIVLNNKIFDDKGIPPINPSQSRLSEIGR